MKFPEKRKRVLKSTIQECLGEAIKLFFLEVINFYLNFRKKISGTEIRINLKKTDNKR